MGFGLRAANTHSAQRPMDTQANISHYTPHIQFDLVGDMLLVLVSGTRCSWCISAGVQKPSVKLGGAAAAADILSQEMCCQQLHKEAVHQAWVAFDNFSGEVVSEEVGNCDFGFRQSAESEPGGETRLPTLPLVVVVGFSFSREGLQSFIIQEVHAGVKLARHNFPNAED